MRLTAVLVACVCLAAMPTSAKSLQEAMAEAYETNPELNAARAALRVVDEQVPQALANWRPTVSAVGSANQEWVYSHPSAVNGVTAPGSLSGAGLSPNLPQAQIPAGHSNLQPYSYGLQLTQPVYRGGRTAADTSRAENAIKAQRAQLVGAEQTLLLNAATAYLDVVRDQQIVDQNAATTVELANIANGFQNRLKAGEVTRTDVAQAVAQQAQRDSGRLLAENQLAISRAAYLRYVGEMPEALVMPMLDYNLPITRDEAEIQSELTNPQVLTAVYTEAAARDSIHLAEGNGLPSVNLLSQAGRQRQGYTGSPPVEDLTVEAQLNIPLYTGGLVSSQVRQAKQTASQRFIEISSARRLAHQQADQAWDTLQANRNSLSLQQRALDAAEDALKGSSIEDKVGTKTTLDVLNAVQVRLNAQTALAQTEHDSALAKLNLLAAVGGLTAENLQLPVGLYDPAHYYGKVRDSWGGTGIEFDRP